MSDELEPGKSYTVEELKAWGFKELKGSVMPYNNRYLYKDTTGVWMADFINGSYLIKKKVA